MPDIKLRDGSGVENTYEGVDTITLPLADGSGTWTFGLSDEELTFDSTNGLFNNNSNKTLFNTYYKYLDRIKFKFNYSSGGHTTIKGTTLINTEGSNESDSFDFSKLIIDADNMVSLTTNDNSMKGVIKLPTIIKNNLYISNDFYLGNIEKLSENEILTFLNHFNKGTCYSGDGGQNGEIYCFNLWSEYVTCPFEDTTAIMTKWNQILNNENSLFNNSWGSLYYRYAYLGSIKKFLLPVPSRINFLLLILCFMTHIFYGVVILLNSVLIMANHIL